MRLTLVRSPERALLTLALALFPFYIFPSGGVQPSHLVFMVLSMLVISSYGLPRQNWLLLLALLSAYSFLVEAIAGLIADDLHHLINSAFLLFNVLLMAGVYWIVQRLGASVLRTGVIAAVIFAVASVQLGGVDLRELGEGGRTAGTFNNPNQLGFFSVCILSLIYLLYLEREIRFPTMLGLLAASVFLSIASLSKAAMLGNFAVLAFALRPGTGRVGITAWIALAASAIAAAAYFFVIGYFEQFLFYERLANMAQEDDSSLVERGYLAFLEGNFLQIIFGMGSPEVYRIVGHEVHSTFASVLNIYGVLGLAIFLPIFAIWGITLRRAYGLSGMIVLMAPAILYGITHNGTRFSIFWLLFATSIGLAKRTRHRRIDSGHRHALRSINLESQA